MSVCNIHRVKYPFSRIAGVGRKHLNDLNSLYFSDIAIEKTPSDAAAFDHDKLKHVETIEKHVLPTQKGNLCILAPSCCSLLGRIL